ncbi:MAG: AAA family ATPase [Promethearchaeota archaeon]|jgi:MoxR-like ATPase
MAKKPVNNRKSISKTPLKQNAPKATKTTKKPTIKSTSTKRNAKTNDKGLDNLTILRNSPYLKQNMNQGSNKAKPTLKELFEKNLLSQKEEKMEIVLSGQYKEALDLIFEADASNLYPILVGPPGIGKTTICRYYAQSRAEITGNDSFEWVTFDESTKPAHLIGSFNPATTIQKGFSFDAFNPGPLIKAMLNGGVFLANEVNRATEYTQNSLLEPLEEKTLSIPHIGRVKSSLGFFFIGAMNPSELVGTHRLSEALKDRFNVWIELDYPDKKTEMRIIKYNNPYYKVDESILEKIYLIINRTRTHHQIQTPASLRSGIALARLTGVAKKKTKKDSNKILKEIARNVLFGAIQTKPGVKTNDVINNIISQVIGTT